MTTGLYDRNVVSVLREESVTFRRDCVAPQDWPGFVPVRFREIDIFDFQQTSYELRIVRVQRIELLRDGPYLRKG